MFSYFFKNNYFSSVLKIPSNNTIIDIVFQNFKAPKQIMLFYRNLSIIRMVVLPVLFLTLLLLVSCGHEEGEDKSSRSSQLLKDGFMKADSGNYEGAISDFTMAIEINPEDSIAYNNRAIAYHNLGNFSKAIKDYTQLITLNPDNSSAFNNRALAKVELGDYRGAIADYTKAIEFSPEESEIFINRGIALYQLNYLDSACLDWSKAGELGDKRAYVLIQDYCQALNAKPNSDPDR